MGRRPAQPAGVRGGHVRGSLSFEHSGDFTNYLGWLIPWGIPLTLLGDSPEQVAAAQRDLARIGIDHLTGAADGTPQEWAGGQPLASFPSRVSLTWPPVPAVNVL